MLQCGNKRIRQPFVVVVVFESVMVIHCCPGVCYDYHFLSRRPSYDSSTTTIIDKEEEEEEGRRRGGVIPVRKGVDDKESFVGRTHSSL